VTGSLKKGEERDLMLGKLFGCLVLVKSGKLSKKDDVDFVAKCLVQLHGWKAWMKELVAETVLLLIERISPTLVIEVLFPLIKEWLAGVTASDMAAWQILLVAGLEQVASSKSDLKRAFASVLPTESLSRAHVFGQLANTLSVATTGYPKVRQIHFLIIRTDVYIAELDKLFLPLCFLFRFIVCGRVFSDICSRSRPSAN